MIEHKRRLTAWLKDLHLPDGETEEEQTIKILAASPSSQVTSWQGHDINGYLFYTPAKDRKTVSQNSGVRIRALDERILVSLIIYGKCTMVPIYKSRSFGVVGSSTRKVLRWTAMDS
jgi:hypothetical protein